MQIEDLSRAADEFAARGLSLREIKKENFRLGSKLEGKLQATREDLTNGKGFALFKGFPTSKWSVEKSATAYMGLGSHLGEFLSQNGKGHILGHVKEYVARMCLVLFAELHVVLEMIPLKSTRFASTRPMRSNSFSKKRPFSSVC